MTKQEKHNRKTAEEKTELTDAQLDTATGGTGPDAGKVTFQPFTITRKVDKSSPIFF